MSSGSFNLLSDYVFTKNSKELIPGWNKYGRGHNLSVENREINAKQFFFVKSIESEVL